MVWVECESLDNLLEIVNRFVVRFRIYCLNPDGIIYCLARSPNNTFTLEIKPKDEKEREYIIKRLEEAEFIRVKRIRRWDA